MRFLSVCSGIEAASVAWKPLGWKAAAFSEIEPFPCAVISHHYPDTPNLGDMTKYKDWPDVSVDLLCGGTPCQSFSAAGLRAGLDDPRGELMLTFGAIAARYRPRWLVWENVPGVLSSNGGRDFGAFLGLLGHIGYGFAYRVLDAQFVRVDGYGRAVPQRRQRVFVVGCLGDWRSAAAVLLERESLRGDPAPRREARQTAPTIPARSTAGGGLGTDFDCDGGVIQVCPTLRAGGNRTGGDRPPGTDVDTADSLIPVDISGTLEAAQSKGTRGQGVIAPMAFGWQNAAAQGMPVDTIAPTLDQRKHPAIATATAVRRLLPVECERLMGFPDGYTAIPYRGKPAADGPRYKAIGNSWAVNCARWIGRRIAMVDAIKKQHREAA